MSFNLTTILDNISQGESFLQYFQLNNGQLNIDFNDTNISWTTRKETELIIFLYINSSNLTSSIELNINKSIDSIPKIYLIDQNGNNIGEVPFSSPLSFSIKDYVSDTISYDEINFKIFEASDSVNGTNMSIEDFIFNKDGAIIPSPDSTPPSTPRSSPSPSPTPQPDICPEAGFASLFPSGDKQQINIVNNGNDVCINNNVVNFTSACPINHSQMNMGGNMSHHTCAGKVDYFKLYPEISTLYISS